VKLIIRKTSVRWKAGTKDGPRTAMTEKGVRKHARFSLSTPRKSDSYTYPAEMIAAAYANSFSLALSDELKLSSVAEGEVTLTATITLQHLAAGWTIMNVHLHVAAKLPKMTERRFINATVRAKTNCLVSGLLPAKISMSAKLDK
jgi:OsmC subfamily peroxiredoxin